MQTKVKFLEEFNGFKIYSTNKVAFASCSVDKKIIFVNEDSFYYHTTSEERKAVIFHEIGHIINAHTGKERGITKELEADSHVIKQGLGKELYNVLTRFLELGFIKMNEEIQARLNLLDNIA